MSGINWSEILTVSKNVSIVKEKLKCNVCVNSKIIVFPEEIRFCCGLPQDEATLCWYSGGNRFVGGAMGKENGGAKMEES